MYKIYVEVKTQRCYQCDYASNKANSSRVHLKIREDKKSYKCFQCGYALPEAAIIRKHMRVYCSGERPINLCSVNMLRRMHNI